MPPPPLGTERNPAIAAPKPQGPPLFLKDCLAFLPGKGFVPRVGISISGGRIRSVGPDLKPPALAEVLDAQGAHATPGLVDGHTHLGMGEVNDSDTSESSDPVTPFLRARDAFNPFNPQVGLALAAGITTVMVCPGSANVFGGLTLVIKTRGTNLDQMAVKEPAGLKMALGQNPKRTHGEKERMPKSRMGTAYLIRRTFQEALEYAENRRRKKEDTPRNEGYENVLAVLKGRIPAKVHCHRNDDIMTALRLADEFQFKMTVEHATEVSLIAEEVARRKVPCFIGPNLGVPYKNEIVNKGFSNAQRLREAGILFGITTDHSVEPCWFLPVAAGLAAREGLDADDALRAITEWPARIMGLEKRLGSLRPRLDADIVLWDGHPLRLSKPAAIFVDGKRVGDEDFAHFGRVPTAYAVGAGGR